MRLDAMPAASRSSSPAASRLVAESEDWLDPDVIKQLSGGSLAGENGISGEQSVRR